MAGKIPGTGTRSSVLLPGPSRQQPSQQVAGSAWEPAWAIPSDQTGGSFWKRRAAGSIDAGHTVLAGLSGQKQSLAG